MTLAEKLSAAVFLLLPASLATSQPVQPVQPARSWSSTLAEGTARARILKSGQLLVSLSAEKCADCDRMDAVILPSPAFETLFGDKALVRLEWGSPDARTLAARYSISSPPAWVWTTADGLLVGLAGGSTTQAKWFETMGSIQAAWKRYQERLDREKADPSDLQLVYEVAVETWNRGGEAAAESRLRRLIADPKTPPAARSGSFAYLASIELDQGRTDEAEVHLKALLAASDDPAMKEKAELRLADVEVMRNDRPRAMQLLTKFKKDHPDSPLTADADQLISLLKRESHSLTLSPAAPSTK